MFKRYTEKARRTIFLARYEASQHGSQYVEAPHLLLGLVRESFPTIQMVSGVEQATLQGALVPLAAKSGEKPLTSVDLPLSQPCKRALTYAAEEAEAMGHGHIGPEHLLLGILRENGPVAQVLGGFGIALETARETFQGAGETPGDKAAGLPSVRAPASRDAVHALVAGLPEERLAAAAQVLAGLSAGYFAVAGVSPEGPFAYTFGQCP